MDAKIGRVVERLNEARQAVIVERRILGAAAALHAATEAGRCRARAGTEPFFASLSWSKGVSMAILEALAAGCATVITQACNFPELAGAGAGTVIPTATQVLGVYNDILAGVRRSAVWFR